jgi:tetratricopeptide (TPR) repeat protein
MKSKANASSLFLISFLLGPGLLGLTAGCGRQSGSPANVAIPLVLQVDREALILVPHEGGARVDEEIRRAQQQMRAGANRELTLEKLGWLFVKKARESFDPGYYKLAEQCSLALEARHPNSQEALLLRAHVLHNLHRFKEAEPLARQLVESRGLPYDFGVLGDSLMEQGKLDDAIAAYQKMINLRPDLHSYARGAHVRWLKGDLKGAEELMNLAVSAASPLDAESAAWVNTRLAGYEFQAGDLVEASRTCSVALDFQKDYPPALLLRGRLLLAAGQNAQAAQVLRRAVELNPLPEYQWELAEALQANGELEQAKAVEAALRLKGAVTDPRTYALYLSTRREELEKAVTLAQAELESRRDVFTYDALAWALAATGKLEQAREQMPHALSQGTSDARLLFHAATIAHRAADDESARRFVERAVSMRQTLLPCELKQFEALTRQLTNTFPLAETDFAGSGNPNKKGKEE